MIQVINELEKMYYLSVICIYFFDFNNNNLWFTND